MSHNPHSGYVVITNIDEEEPKKDEEIRTVGNIDALQLDKDDKDEQFENLQLNCEQHDAVDTANKLYSDDRSCNDEEFTHNSSSAQLEIVSLDSGNHSKEDLSPIIENSLNKTVNGTTPAIKKECIEVLIAHSNEFLIDKELSENALSGISVENDDSAIDSDTIRDSDSKNNSTDAPVHIVEELSGKIATETSNTPLVESNEDTRKRCNDEPVCIAQEFAEKTENGFPDILVESEITGDVDTRKRTNDEPVHIAQDTAERTENGLPDISISENITTGCRNNNVEELPSESTLQPKVKEENAIVESSVKDASGISSENPFENCTSNETVEETIVSPTEPKKEVEKEDEKEDKKEDEPEEWIDVLGNGLLKKKVLRKGEGRETRPVSGNLVDIRYTGRIEDGTIIKESDNLQFILSEETVVEALDLCIALMEKGEVAEIVTDARYAYGARGRPTFEPAIPPNATVTYEVEIIKVQEGPNFAKLAPVEKINYANAKKVAGNELYTLGDYAGSINAYRRGLKYLEHSSDPEVMHIKIKLLNNLSASQLKVKAYLMAITSLDTVLQLEPQNMKALFRKGKCLEGLGKDNEALKCLKEASMLDPNNKMIKQDLSEVRARLAKTLEKEKEMYGRMFNRKKDEKPNETSWSSIIIGSSAVALVGIIAGFLYFKKHI